MLNPFDYTAVDQELPRALVNVGSEAREAVSAARNILEQKGTRNLASLGRCSAGSFVPAWPMASDPQST